MPDYDITLYRLDTIPGVPANSTDAVDAFNIGGTTTFSGSTLNVTITDDDVFAEDYDTQAAIENPETGADAVLANAETVFGNSYAAGTEIHAVAQVEVTNTTTGETGFAQIINISDSGFSESYLAFPFPVSPGDSLTFVATDNDPVDGNAFGASQGYQYSQLLVCFADGTRIKTETGARPVETLKVGDLVWTRENGLQPIRWIACRPVSGIAQLINEKLRPIRIAPGALGKGVPRDPLRLSRQHRVLVTSNIACKMFGSEGALVPARYLVGQPGITVEHSLKETVYYHILMDRHEILDANGAACESLLLGPQVQGKMTIADPEEHALIFDALGDADGAMHPARPLPGPGQVKRLMFRHSRNPARAFCE